MTPDFSLARTDAGEYVCPAAGCSATFDIVMGAIQHHSISHDTSIAVDLVGEDDWRQYLTDARSSGWSLDAICRGLPEHIGRATVRRDVHAFNIPGPDFSPSKGAAAILALPHVTTIEEARAEAQRRREARS